MLIKVFGKYNNLDLEKEKVLFRFRAENPGVWFMHCHMSWHNHVGMGLVLQIGTSFHTIQTDFFNVFKVLFKQC